MTIAIPLTVELIGLDKPYVWSKQGDPLPRDYFVIERGDCGLCFHLGALGIAAQMVNPNSVDLTRAYHLPAHRRVIKDANGIVLDDVNLPGHWWGADSVWRPAPLTVLNTPAALEARRRLFPMGFMGKKIGVVGGYIDGGPMAFNGIERGMPITGERRDIGLETDAGAYFNETGIADPVIIWGLGGESCPNKFRDEATGKPVDLIKYPFANCADLPGLQGWPYLPKGPKMADPLNYQTWGGGWVPQQAHYCEMSYVAFQATYDEDFLADLQFSANFTVACDAYFSVQQGKALFHGEYRGAAWAFRNLCMAHVATKDYEDYCAGKEIPFPARLMPSTYFKALLDNALPFYNKSLTDPTRQVFRIVSDLVHAGDPDTVVFPPWQCDYMIIALAFGVLTGHDDWAPLYLWALKNAIDRTDAASGYPVGWGGGYYYDASQPSWKAAWLAGVPNLGGAEPPTAAEIATLTADPYNGHVIFKPNSIEYMMGTYAVLTTAQYLANKGYCDVRARYPNIDFCENNAKLMLLNDPNAMNPRDSYLPTDDGSPNQIPPPVVIPPPPPAPIPAPPPPPVPKLPVTLAGILTRAQNILALVKALP